MRERRVHVTQEDFEMAVTKVCTCPAFLRIFFMLLFLKHDGFLTDSHVIDLCLLPRSCKRILRKTCRSRNFGSKTAGPRIDNIRCKKAN